jgi:C4-type Zn-finger protein
MKITKSRLKQIIKEELETTLEEGHGGEGSMAQGQLQRIGELADMISQQFDDSTNLEEWVESKITKALDYLSSVMNYMRGEDDETAMSSKDPMGGMSRNEYMWDKTAKAFPEEYEGQENPFKMPKAAPIGSAEERRRRFYRNRE